ncbi:MAG: hypothetical protein AABX14_00995 [Candidatus Aenigmatarchaeota archaeon]
MIEIKGNVGKRDGLFVVMIPYKIAKKENMKDGQKFNITIKKVYR